MAEVMFIALMLSVPLWLIVHELTEVNKNLNEMLYEDEDEEEE